MGDTVKNNLRNFSRWFNSLTGIRGKIMGIAVFLVMLLGSWITWQAYTTSTSVLQEQLEMRGISIARDVAARSVNPIFIHNLYELHQLVRDTLENNDDVVYIFIQDVDGNVLVHSFSGRGVPLVLKDLNPVDGDTRFKIVSFFSEKGLVHDVAVPVFEGRAGTVRLGMGEDQLRRTVNAMTGSMIFSVLVVFALGILAAYFLATRLRAPLHQLIEGTHSVAAGNFGVRVEPWARDELGALAETFNLMTDKLEAYRQENIATRTELERKKKLRIQLVEKIISAQEDERKRIARELHDETSQALTSLKMGLMVIEEATDHAHASLVAAELREMLGHTLNEVSTLARDLRPSVLDDMGLDKALLNFIEQCAIRLNQPIDFHREGLEGARFPSYVETAVYRVVQEALTNVMKYAAAENISVVVRYGNGTLSAIIEDDGVGFSVHEVLSGRDDKKGLGLFGMQERASLIGGVLEIESSPGEGTTIYLNVQLGGEINAGSG
jgi:signal transduction histidine kinase